MTQSKLIHDFLKKAKPSVGDVVVAAAVASLCSCGYTGGKMKRIYSTSSEVRLVKPQWIAVVACGRGGGRQAHNAKTAPTQSSVTAC